MHTYISRESILCLCAPENKGCTKEGRDMATACSLPTNLGDGLFHVPACFDKTWCVGVLTLYCGLRSCLGASLALWKSREHTSCRFRHQIVQWFVKAKYIYIYKMIPVPELNPGVQYKIILLTMFSLSNFACWFDSVWHSKIELLWHVLRSSRGWESKKSKNL